MASRTMQVTEYLCDGCGKVFHTDPEGDLPYGYHGTVMHISGGGGWSFDWFACTQRCIRRAVLSAEAERDT